MTPPENTLAVTVCGNKYEIVYNESLSYFGISHPDLDMDFFTQGDSANHIAKNAGLDEDGSWDPEAIVQYVEGCGALEIPK